MNQNPGVYGYKLGNMQLFAEDGSVQRVTVVEAGPVVVLAKRTQEKDGYSALVLGLGERKEKHTNKPRAGYFKKIGATPKKVVKELRVPADYVAKFEVGQTLKLDELFQAGQKVDAQGTTRGRGFTGVVRRWAFAGFVQTHGTHEYRRHGGSIGTNMTPGRTLPNLKMPGHYGAEKLSILNLKVAKIIPEKNLLLIEGAVPGPKGGLVLVRHAVKARAKKK
ncbi:MAG TPA: 50S ribosomal protein L3 [Polyangiaceae bacterium]|jgi:large subunit ribosomal protein L3